MDRRTFFKRFVAVAGVAIVVPTAVAMAAKAKPVVPTITASKDGLFGFITAKSRRKYISHSNKWVMITGEHGMNEFNKVAREASREIIRAQDKHLSDMIFNGMKK